MASSNGTPRTSDRRVAQLATISILGIVYFFVAVGGLHFLRPEIDPVKHMASYYAVGPYGFLMTAAFFAFALSAFTLGVGLYQGVSLSSRSRPGLILLNIASVGLVLSGIYPTDITPDNSPSTATGVIHILGGVVAFLCIIVAAVLWSRRFGQDSRWKSFERISWGFAIAGLVAFIMFFVIVASQLPIGGLGERIVIPLMQLWILLTAARLRSIARRST